MKKLMKAALLIAIIGISVSCNNQQEKEAEEKEKEIIPNHELMNTENMTIIENYEKDTEWDMISRSSLQVKGYKLADALRLIACESPAKVIVKDAENHPNPRMMIEYKPGDVWEATDGQNRQIVLDSLQKYYDFTITRETREMDTWVLSEYDKELLKARTDNALGKSGKTVNDIRTYKNYTFSDLAEQLERDLNVLFTSSIDDNNRYDFEKINIGSTERALEDLNDKYGMLFAKKKEAVEMTIINLQ